MKCQKHNYKCLWSHSLQSTQQIKHLAAWLFNVKGTLAWNFTTFVLVRSQRLDYVKILLPSSVDELMFTDVMHKRCVIGSFQLLILINKYLLDVRLWRHSITIKINVFFIKISLIINIFVMKCIENIFYLIFSAESNQKKHVYFFVQVSL